MTNVKNFVSCLSVLSTLNQAEYISGHYGENYPMFSIREFKLFFIMSMTNVKITNIGFPQYYMFH